MRRTVLLGLLVAAGCGDLSGRVPVAGVVTLDGDTVSGATIAFFPEPGSPGQGGFGKSDDQGRFEIAYDPSTKGLVPGQYRVTVAKPSANSADGMIDASIRSGGGLPSLYANPDTTPLRVTVEPGRTVELKLTRVATKK